MIAQFGILFLVLVSVTSAAVYHLRDIVMFYFEDKYNIKIEKDECETLDTNSEDSGCRADGGGYRNNGDMLEKAGR